MSEHNTQAPAPPMPSPAVGKYPETHFVHSPLAHVAHRPVPLVAEHVAHRVAFCAAHIMLPPEPVAHTVCPPSVARHALQPVWGTPVVPVITPDEHVGGRGPHEHWQYLHSQMDPAEHAA